MSCQSRAKQAGRGAHFVGAECPSPRSWRSPNHGGCGMTADTCHGYLPSRIALDDLCLTPEIALYSEKIAKPLGFPAWVGSWFWTPSRELHSCSRRLQPFSDAEVDLGSKGRSPLFRRQFRRAAAFCGRGRALSQAASRVRPLLPSPAQDFAVAFPLARRKLFLRQLDTNRIECCELSSTAAAILPKYSVSPAGRPTPITTRS
jgi:hypothetical protein